MRAGADITNKQGKRLLRAPGNQGAPSDIGETYLANPPVCICVMVSLKCSLTEFLSGAEFCKLENPLIITTCRYDVNKRFIVQCRQLHWLTERREIAMNWSEWPGMTAFCDYRDSTLCTLSRLYNTVWLSQKGYINLREEIIVFCVMFLFVLMFQNDSLVCFSWVRINAQMRWLEIFS